MHGDRERLEAAYEATAYRVAEGPRGRFVIRVGRRSPDAEALLAESRADAWAFITAVNPRSVPLPDADNAARMTRLAEVVAGLGLPHYRGAGVADDARWPPEPSLLVIGLAERQAVRLARDFGQSAIVVGRHGEPARLAWIGDEAPADAGPTPRDGSR